MPVEIEHSEAQGIIIKGLGVVDFPDISHAQAQIHSVPTQSLKFQLYDFSAVEIFSMGSDEIRKIAQQDFIIAHQHPEYLLAAVGKTDFIYGIMSIWQANVETPHNNSRVFRELQQAYNWINKK